MFSALFDNGVAYEGSLVKVQPFSVILIIVLGSLGIHHWLNRLPKTAKFPLVNPAQGLELTDIGRRKDWFLHGSRILRDAEASNPDRPFNMLTGSGEMTILPPYMADELRSEPELSFLKYLYQDHSGHLPGFEVFAALCEEKLVVAVINKHLTKYLSKCTKPLSTEASHAVEVNFGSATEWRPVMAYETMLDVVSRVSSRMFLGEELCRDPDWLDVTKRFTNLAFGTAAALKSYPLWLRPLLNRVMPESRELRRFAARGREIVAPVIHRRQALCEEAVLQKKPVPRFDDAISWFEEEGADPRLDPATLQLMLSVVSIHTTTDLLTETLLQLSRQPQLIEELRAEISGVLKTRGWDKQALFNMKLLDSVIKETQRVAPILLASMQRTATADIKLSTGDVIPKGAILACSMSNHHDPDTYEDPLTFKGDRFLSWRGTDQDSAANLVSTGPASLGFGHGKHACPGRFFAASEIKISLCHLLVKYDWELAPGESIEPALSGFTQVANPMARVMVRRRANVDLDIDSLL